MFEVVFFPLYGITVGINYWNTTMDEWPDWIEKEEEEVQHMVQIFCFASHLANLIYLSILSFLA